MVFPSVYVCGGDLWWSVSDAAAICIVNVVGQQQQQQEHQQHQQHQKKQLNGAVSIFATLHEIQIVPLVISRIP